MKPLTAVLLLLAMTLLMVAPVPTAVNKTLVNIPALVADGTGPPPHFPPWFV